MTTLTPSRFEVHPYAARPEVDVEAEGVGTELRAAVWNLFNSDIYNRPDEIIDLFHALLTDIAIEHGWWCDGEGQWYMPVLYAEAHA